MIIRGIFKRGRSFGDGIWHLIVIISDNGSKALAGSVEPLCWLADWMNGTLCQ